MTTPWGILGRPVLECVDMPDVAAGAFKRYVRAVLTKNGGTSIAAGAVLLKGDALVRPVT